MRRIERARTRWPFVMGGRTPKKSKNVRYLLGDQGSLAPLEKTQGLVKDVQGRE